MPRKKKRSVRPQPTEIANLEATAKKLQSLLNMPEMWGFARSGLARGVREKVLAIDYQTIRNVVQRVPLISAIVNTRVLQVKRFCQYKYDEGKPGFEFVWKDPAKKVTEADRKYFIKLAGFIEETGLIEDETREDDFADYLDMFAREVLTVDQIATEVQRNRKGEPVAFWMLDGSSIKRIDPKEFKAGNKEFQITEKTRYCQVVEQQITNVYTGEDLIFDYMNKRADLRFRGFGYSCTEQCIDLITTLLFGYTYLRDQLMRDRVPKGFIQVMGDVGRDQLDAIREYWYSAMSGAGGSWNIPILPSGKDGIGLDWKNIQNTNRDMEYHKTMMFLSSVIAAVFSIDLAEMGIKADDSSALIGETAEPRINASKDRGLRGLLEFIQQHVNKIVKKINKDVRFRFVGLEPENEDKAADLRKKEVETRLTINELRKADGYEPLEDEYADYVMNPNAIQLIMADKQAAAQKEQTQMQIDAGGEEGETPGGEKKGGGEEEEEEEGDLGTEVDWDAIFNKSQSSPKKTVRVIIE